MIVRRAGNLRAVQLLLEHTKLESTARYLGVEVNDALAIAEQFDICGKHTMIPSAVEAAALDPKQR